MFRNYFTVALRNFFSRKRGNAFFTILNLAGLVIGLAAFLIIAHLVRYELGFDSTFPNAENIYRIKVEKSENGQVTMESAKTYPGIGGILLAEIPGVKSFTRVLAEECMLHYKEKGIKFNRQNTYWADANFASLFGLEFIEKGDLSMLEKPYTAILSKSAAERFFGMDWSGENNPVGKTIWLNEGLAFVVQGVFNDIPSDSHIEVDFIVSYATLIRLVGPGFDTGMPPFRNAVYTYISLSPGASSQRIEEIAGRVLSEKIPATVSNEARYHFGLQPLRSIHLDSHLADELKPNGSRLFVLALSLAAVLIVLVAWINFINLTTARAMNRAKEVGVRKAIGSSRKQLVFQFVFEALLSCTLAAVGAVVLVFFVSPYFESLAGIQVSVFSWEGEGIYSWIFFMLILLAGGLLSSIYPAIILSSFKPVDVLKGKIMGISGKAHLRKGLITFQFFFAVFLLSCTGAIYYQVKYMRQQELGMDTDQVLILHTPRSMIGNQKRAHFFENFREKLMKYPAIKNVGASGCLPGHDFLFHQEGIRQSGKEDGKDALFDVASVEEGYLPALGFKLLSGRNFSNREGEGGKVMLNETAVKVLGFKNAEEAIGKTLLVRDEKQYQITGVVADAHYEGLQKTIKPLLLFYGHGYEFGFFSLKINSKNVAQTIATVKHHWNAIYPRDPFDYFFLDSFFDQQYKSEHIFGKVFGMFSFLAIFIACLGLVGLVSFTTVQKTKEIGIRKVLGASFSGIIALLAREFFKPILLACAVAIPVTHLIISAWLNTFAYPFQLSWWMHLLPFVVINSIAFLFISSQSFNAARANPVKALKEE